MKNPTFGRSPWSTSSFGEAADTTPMELSALGEHLSLCKSLSGRLFAVRRQAGMMHGVIASRLVTTVVTVVAVGLVVSGLMAW